jgi:hypothetical protein
MKGRVSAQLGPLGGAGLNRWSLIFRHTVTETGSVLIISCKGGKVSTQLSLL